MRQSGPQNAPNTPPNATRKIGQKSPEQKERGVRGAAAPGRGGLGGPPRAPQAREAAPIQAARRSSLYSPKAMRGPLIRLLPYIRS